MKIVHIITSLNKGGAEGNLYRLCKFHKKKYQNKIDISVITLISKGFYENELKKVGINVLSLKINKTLNLFNTLKKILKFRAIIKKKNPDIIQSWMYHSNFITLFLPKIFYKKIFWNIRHTKLNLKFSKKLTILLSLVCGLFSKYVPKKIIYCSDISIRFHENYYFYSKKKTVLINNGFSNNTYYPSKNIRTKFRKKNKINNTDIVLGFAGRYVLEKNINSLLIAFLKIIKKYNNIKLYMVGKDINYSNHELKKNIFNLNIENNVFFLNEQKNLLEFYNGIDLLILPSLSESFPNVVAESMLCSTPVLSSDVGCSRQIIGNYGFIMDKNDFLSISNHVIKIINIIHNKKNEWKQFKKNSKIKIIQEFSEKKMADKYLKEWVF